MSDPRSAGETPAAPPDPWNIGRCPRCESKRPDRRNLVSYSTADEDAMMEPCRDEWHETAARLAKAEADLTAARAEIARLTAQLAEHEQGIAMQHARKQSNADGFQRGWHAALTRVAEGDPYRDLVGLVPIIDERIRERLEAAEASLLALQQQMGNVFLRMTVAGTWGAVENLISEARAALASHLTGGPA